MKRRAEALRTVPEESLTLRAATDETMVRALSLFPSRRYSHTLFGAPPEPFQLPVPKLGLGTTSLPNED